MTKAGAMALDACEQESTRLEWQDVGGGFAVSYTPADRTRVINISALCARLLARGGSERAQYTERAEGLVRFVLGSQRHDGSWPYALDRGAGWEDSFHTGYVLESLLCVAERGIRIPEEAVARGFTAYRRFFDSDGGARLRAEATGSYDAHSAAQGVLTYASLARSRFGEVAAREGAMKRAHAIAEWALARLWLPDAGHFAYRIQNDRVDRRNFLRWVQAPRERAVTA